MDYKIDIKVNKSKLYFTPLFNEEVQVSYFKLLKNTYFWYDDFKKETFCLLYQFDGKVSGKFNSRKGFTIYEQTILMRNKLFRGYRDFDEYVIYEFNLSDRLLEYRDLLLEGRYSKFSEETKEIILNFHLRLYGPNERDHIGKILYKDEKLMNDLADKYGVKVNMLPEASSKIIPERELFANCVTKREEKNEFKRIQ